METVRAQRPDLFFFYRTYVIKTKSEVDGGDFDRQTEELTTRPSDSKSFHVSVGNRRDDDDDDESVRFSPRKSRPRTITTDDALLLYCSTRNRFRRERNIIPTTTTKLKNHQSRLSNDKTVRTGHVVFVLLGLDTAKTVRYLYRLKQTHVLCWPARGDGNPCIQIRKAVVVFVDFSCFAFQYRSTV